MTQPKKKIRLVVSNSERATFLQCRKRWWFEYVELLRPIVVARLLTWGRVFHGGAEAGYRAAYTGPRDRMRRACEAAAEAIALLAEVTRGGLLQAHRDGHLSADEYEARLEDTMEMAKVGSWAIPHMFERTVMDFERLVPLAFEAPILAPVLNAKGRPGALWNEGQVDAVWWDRATEQVLVDDLKTQDGDAANPTVERRIQLDPQMTGYIEGVRHKARTGQLVALDGTDIDQRKLMLGVRGWCRYNVVRRSYPHEPSVNKDGTVSVAKIDTTGEVYAMALAEQEVTRHIPITEKQRELLLRLGNQVDRYFSRHEFARNAHDVAEWRSDLWSDSKLMRDAIRNPKLATRNPGACTPANALPCVYRRPCLRDEPETREAFRVASDKHEEISREQEKGQHEETNEVSKAEGGREAGEGRGAVNFGF